MKQYTNESQTAQLIELGFEKPKSERWVLDVANESTPSIQNIVKRQDYSIGELIEMLLSKPHCRVSIYNVGLRQHKVLFKKLINGKFKVLFREVGHEPIDLLFNCIVKLKEEGIL
jgi:hypothetical protein